MPQYPLNPVSIIGHLLLLQDSQITATGTATALAAYTEPSPNTAENSYHHVESVVIQADPGNGANNIIVGNSSSQSVVLTAGTFYTLQLRDPTQVYLKASGGSPKANVQYFGH